MISLIEQGGAAQIGKLLGSQVSPAPQGKSVQCQLSHGDAAEAKDDYLRADKRTIDERLGKKPKKQ